MSITLQGQIKQTGRTAINPVSPPEPPPPPVFTNTLAYTLNNPAPVSNDRFGGAVDISGNRFIVGAYGPSDTGSVRVFDVSTGNLLHTLNNPTPEANDLFGFSASISGNRAIVGARGESSSGSAYIFDVTTGNLLHTINNPTPQSGDNFGHSVSIGGNIAIVGAFNDNTGATDAGSAYIFDVTTGNLLHTINNPTPQPSDQFGIKVSISGNNVIIGAQGESSITGRAYIYDATTGNLLHTINNPQPTPGDRFGGHVSIDGDRAIIGAHEDDNSGLINNGRAYIYDATTGNLLHVLDHPNTEAGDQFGRGVSISGNLAVVTCGFGDTGATDTGEVFIFDVTTGDLLHTINNPTPEVNDSFGLQAVAIDGVNVVIGARDDNTGATSAGSVYVYN